MPPDHSQPCETVIRLEGRVTHLEKEQDSLTGWVRRIDHAQQDLNISTAREIAILQTKMLVVSAVGALVGSILGAILTGIVVYRLTGR